METMSADIIPAGQDRGSFLITDAMLIETGSASLAAFEVLIREEARRRGLRLSTTDDFSTGGILVRWRPER